VALYIYSNSFRPFGSCQQHLLKLPHEFTEHRLSLYTYLQGKGYLDSSLVVIATSRSASILLVAKEPCLSHALGASLSLIYLTVIVT
jgi:hypothetical protein